MSRPTGRRSFIKRAMAATGATWIGSSSPAILNAFEVREKLSVSKLEHLKDQLAARQTTGLLVGIECGAFCVRRLDLEFSS